MPSAKPSLPPYNRTNLFSTYPKHNSLYVGIIGFVLTAAITLVVFLLLRRRIELQTLVDVRTAALERSNERFHQLAEKGRLIVDHEGRYTYISPTVASVLGYTPEEVINKKGARQV